MVLPFAWHVLVNKHSSVHCWMTYRSLAMTVFALAFGVLYLFDPCYLMVLKSRVEGYLWGDGPAD